MTSTQPKLKPAPAWYQQAGRRRRIDGYAFTGDAQECARLIFDHHLQKLAWRKNYLAPIQAPQAVLDVACGPGIWGYELLQRFPETMVLNLDIDEVLFHQFLQKVPPKPNFHFVSADARDPLPFPTGTFDFTHTRLPEFLSEEHWPLFIRELTRVTKPNGWVEIVTVSLYYCGQPSEAATAFSEKGMQLARIMGVTIGVLRFSDYLRQAGVSAKIKTVVVGKGQRQQQMLLKDMLHVEQQLKDLLIASGMMTETEFDHSIEQLQRDAQASGFFQPYHRVCFQPRDVHPPIHETTVPEAESNDDRREVH